MVFGGDYGARVDGEFARERLRPLSPPRSADPRRQRCGGIHFNPLKVFKVFRPRIVAGGNAEQDVIIMITIISIIIIINNKFGTQARPGQAFVREGRDIRHGVEEFVTSHLWDGTPFLRKVCFLVPFCSLLLRILRLRTCSAWSHSLRLFRICNYLLPTSLCLLLITL